MGNKASKQIDALIDQASKIAIAEVERLARKALTTRGRAHSFCMAMGSATFYDKKGDAIDDMEQHSTNNGWDTDYRRVKLQRCIHDAYDFINAHDATLKISGYPMRIDSPTSPTLNDW